MNLYCFDLFSKPCDLYLCREGLSISDSFAPLAEHSVLISQFVILIIPLRQHQYDCVSLCDGHITTCSTSWTNTRIDTSSALRSAMSRLCWSIIQNLDTFPDFKLLSDDTLYSSTHCLHFETLEGKCKHHALTSTTVQLHQLERILSLKLPEACYVLFQFFGKLLQTILTQWLMTEVIKTLLGPIEVEPIFVDGAHTSLGLNGFFNELSELWIFGCHIVDHSDLSFFFDVRVASQVHSSSFHRWLKLASIQLIVLLQ